MSGMRGWAAVTGVAERKPTRWTEGETTIDMFARIGVQAVADAGLQLSDIDGLICHPMGGVPMLVPSTLLEEMGIRANFAETVDLGGATGAGMVWRAAAAIAAGQARAVLCVTASRRGSKMTVTGPRRTPTSSLQRTSMGVAPRSRSYDTVVNVRGRGWRVAGSIDHAIAPRSENASSSGSGMTRSPSSRRGSRWRRRPVSPTR